MSLCHKRAVMEARAAGLEDPDAMAEYPHRSEMDREGGGLWLWVACFAGGVVAAVLVRWLLT